MHNFSKLKIKHLISIILTVAINIVHGAAPPFAIQLNNGNAIEYCTMPVPIAEKLTIEGTPNIKGMKISITDGYKASEDELAYSGNVLAKNWSVATGTLELTGGPTTTVQDYVDAIRSIVYKNNKAIPTLGTRKITVSLNDADYLPETGHFYRYISSNLISWDNAKNEAASDAMTYYGLRGYLATITSSVENEFIKLRTKGVGWIGASDREVEGVWRWVTGPEALEDGSGRLFWKGKGIDHRNNVPGTGPYLGRFNDWNTDEPNNTDNDEDYAHILFFPNNPSESLRWNDLPIIGGKNEYVSKGYLIEFGGTIGDPVLNLSATIVLQVKTMVFEQGAIPPICEGDGTMLNQPDTTNAIYDWTPSVSLFSPIIANPVASPIVTTTYTVTGTRGTCSATTSYTVNVDPAPVSLLKPIENICKGGNITLNPGTFKGYEWGNGAKSPTITVGVAGDYSVKLTTDKGCSGTSVSKVIVNENPVIDLSSLQKTICGDAKATTVVVSSDKLVDWTLASDNPNVMVDGLSVAVADFGNYPFVLTAKDKLSCVSTASFELGFYKIPVVGFTIDEQKCYGYNLDASYIGDADVNLARFTWVFGGDTIVDGTGHYHQKIPLGVGQSKRDLVLTVWQDGCSAQHTISDIRVIPTLSISVKDTIRCRPDAFEFHASNTETGVGYDWDFGDNTTGTGAGPKHTYAKDGKYDIQLTVTTDKNCSNMALIKDMVYVAPVPTIGFTLPPDTCLTTGENMVSYVGTGDSMDKYAWDLSKLAPPEIIRDPGSASGPLIFILKLKPSAPIGLMVISKFGCLSVPATITLKRKPNFSIGFSPIAGCVPFVPTLSATINDPVDKVNFNWDFGDGSTGTGPYPTHTYTSPDKNYFIGLTGRSSVTGCINSLNYKDMLSTYPKPVAAFAMDNEVVYTDVPDINFIDNSIGATSFLWDFGDGTTSSAQNPSHHFIMTGHLKVLLEVSNGYQCTDTVSHGVLIAFDRLFPPNAFSPNSPNYLDREYLLNSEGITAKGYDLKIFSRWDDIVFETKDEIKGWDGRMKNGNFAPSGCYFWILGYTDFLGRRHRQTGKVTLLY